MNNGNESAYPISNTVHTGFDHSGEKLFTTTVEGGLTKREMFAMAAMQGILSACQGYTNKPNDMEHIARTATRQADALLKALSE